jgi:hypothetical protein
MGVLARLTMISARSPRVAITPDTAVTIATVWACLRYLSQTVAVLPWHVKKDGKNGPEIQSSHGVDYLLWKRPSKEWSSFQFRETLTHWALRWGNGYAEIEPRSARPAVCAVADPSRARAVCRATEPERRRLRRRRSPAISSTRSQRPTAPGQASSLAPSEHVPSPRLRRRSGRRQRDRLCRAVARLGARGAAVRRGVLRQRHEPAGVVINKKPLKPDGLKRQKAEFEQLYKGPNNATRPRSSTTTRTGSRSASMRASAADRGASISGRGNLPLVRRAAAQGACICCARRSPTSNRRASKSSSTRISPWVKRFEDEADFKLFGQNRQGSTPRSTCGPDARRYARRASPTTRHAFEIGAYSPNRILELEDENTIGADGDKRSKIAGGQPAPPARPTGLRPRRARMRAPTPHRIRKSARTKTQARLGRRLYALEQLMGEAAHV